MARQEEVSVQFYQKKLETDSQSLVFSRLADCYRKKGEIQQAIGVCMQGLQIHPGYVTGRIILGRCYLEQEKLKEATVEFMHVIELDRRNQVAVKMLADVYARQGMKEKAGDLYAYLLRMDPDNQSLAMLAQANRGNGETNVMRVLGITTGTLDKGVSADLGLQEPPPEVSQSPLDLPDSQAAQSPFDTITDIDKTIQMDIVSKQQEGRLGDTAELGEMLVKTQKFDTEELNAAADAGPYRVEETISDIGAKQGDADADAITGDDISSRMAMIFGDEQDGEPKPAEMTPDATDVAANDGESHTIQVDTIDSKDKAATPAASGSDITSRIEQLFGDDQPSGKPDPGETAASDFTQKPGESGDISGKDVTDRLNEMFSDDASASASITEPLAEIGKMLDLQTSAVDEEAPAAISGDDVALRLDTIFEDNEKTDAPSEMEATTVQEDSAARPEEGTRPPVEISDHAIVIGGDSSNSDIHEQGEATLFGAETLTEDDKKEDGVAAAPAVTVGPELNIDDAVPPEMQPELSGNDVVGRLDELFSDNLADTGGLESIPDGDKDDGEVNQGFYTMSGENAQTAAPEDGMLSELDKSYSEESEKETLDVSYEAADKTVLMEQDDRDITPTVAADDRTQADTSTDADAQYSIPDHVLTPTLADIYYQQGQPKLALQIYNRLLESDPDDERIAARIREIERFVAAQETEETAIVDGKRNKTAPLPSGAVDEETPSRKKPVGGAKPLAGVRIKKVFKNRIRKSR